MYSTSQSVIVLQTNDHLFISISWMSDFLANIPLLVSAASRLHKKLMYTNEHQKCSLESCKRELQAQKFELVSLKAAAAQDKGCTMSKKDEKHNRVDSLEQELRMVT